MSSGVQDGKSYSNQSTLTRLRKKSPTSLSIQEAQEEKKLPLFSVDPHLVSHNHIHGLICQRYQRGKYWRQTTNREIRQMLLTNRHQLLDQLFIFFHYCYCDCRTSYLIIVGLSKLLRQTHYSSAFSLSARATPSLQGCLRTKPSFCDSVSSIPTIKCHSTHTRNMVSLLAMALPLPAAPCYD